MKDLLPELLNGSTLKEVAASIAERKARLHAVNWGKWPHLPELPLWRLVAQSLGIEPSALSPTEHIDEHDAIALAGQPFRDRLEVAMANLAGPYEDDRGPLPDVGALMVVRPGSHKRENAWVSTSAFRAWAVAIGWTLPAGFAPQKNIEPGTHASTADRLAVIAAMLDTIRATRGISQSRVIVEIEEADLAKGLGKATLEKVFAAANRGEAEEKLSDACQRCVRALFSVLEFNDPAGPADRAKVIAAVTGRCPGLSSQRVSEVLAAP
ncbi:hypothetical protein OKW41_005539 [Paraburkholderia sp. UCT70]|uniref:Uncharacterized protein n=1 Tax=Paraburkholderia podalyriae TaxID=1938811 RepID=A0ABR7PJ32_9BURK|nr:hypothetical protein [Paraburkholderia podalyriae]MBC8745794.1 hypothetical protein [Paraburkholderia podalyriae]